MATPEDIRGHYVKVKGTRTFYDELGAGQPIVCVHTAGASSLEYQYLLPLLADRGFHAYALDLPGHSRSYPVKWRQHRSIHEHAEFVHAFIKALKLQHPVVIGCSIGGDITLDYAAHHWQEMAAGVPMEGLARSPTFPLPAGLIHPAWAPGWQDMMERAAVESLNPQCPPDKIEELRWQHRNAQVSAVGDLEGWAQHDVRALLPAVQCPMLVVRGEDDFWVPKELAEETARLLPKGQVVHLKNIGHYPMFEDPLLTADLVTKFCRKNGVLK
ncbi:MAG: alpha/beta hydrolase [Gammaproteobacteria bacterium]|nr:alpha/beta hydrolase [Gammaproteobacteria bacterium]